MPPLNIITDHLEICQERLEHAPLPVGSLWHGPLFILYLSIRLNLVITVSRTPKSNEGKTVNLEGHVIFPLPDTVDVATGLLWQVLDRCTWELLYNRPMCGKAEGTA